MAFLASNFHASSSTPYRPQFSTACEYAASDSSASSCTMNLIASGPSASSLRSSATAFSASALALFPASSQSGLWRFQSAFWHSLLQ